MSIGEIGHFLLTPLYYAVSAVLLGWHWFFSLFLPYDGGASWVLSIVGLTVVVRAALIPLFVKQINASRNMQLIQPKVKELQKKYGHDREKLAQETMALYRESGTNPFASCLPLLVQSPIFIALFRLLDQAQKHGTANGFMTPAQAASLGHAKLFGTIPISATFLHNQDLVSVRIVAAILVAAMTATTFTTQRQLMTKNMPKDAMSGRTRSSRRCCSTCCRWSSPSAASRSRSVSSSTGPPPTCGRWASSSTSSATIRRRERRRTTPS